MSSERTPEQGDHAAGGSQEFASVATSPANDDAAATIQVIQHNLQQPGIDHKPEASAETPIAAPVFLQDAGTREMSSTSRQAWELKIAVARVKLFAANQIVSVSALRSLEAYQEADEAAQAAAASAQAAVMAAQAAAAADSDQVAIDSAQAATNSEQATNQFLSVVTHAAQEAKTWSTATCSSLTTMETLIQNLRAELKL